MKDQELAMFDRMKYILGQAKEVVYMYKFTNQFCVGVPDLHKYNHDRMMFRGGLLLEVFKKMTQTLFWPSCL